MGFIFSKLHHKASTKGVILSTGVTDATPPPPKADTGAHGRQQLAVIAATKISPDISGLTVSCGRLCQSFRGGPVGVGTLFLQSQVFCHKLLTLQDYLLVPTARTTEIKIQSYADFLSNLFLCFTGAFQEPEQGSPERARL